MAIQAIAPMRFDGGFQFIEFNDPVARSTRLDLPSAVVRALPERLMLGYTGRSRVSGNIIASEDARCLGDQPSNR